MEICELEKCYEKHIGVLGCHNTGDCKYFINDIPGISNELLSAISTNERDNYLEVYQKALKASLLKLRGDIKQVLYDYKNRHEFGNTLYTSEQARMVYPREYRIPENRTVGILLTTAAGKYVEAKVNTLTLYPRTTIKATPIIYNYETGKVISRAEEIELVEGELVNVDFDYTIECSEHRAIFVGFEFERYPELAVLSCNRFKESTCKTCTPCESICGDGDEQDFRQKLQNVLKDKNSDYAIYTVGVDDFKDAGTYRELDPIICADVSLSCSMEQFLCQNAEALAPTLLYYVAHCILTEKITSTRQNMWAKGNVEFTPYLREEFLKEYKHRLKRLGPELVEDNEESICWQCVNGSMWVESLV